MFALPALSCSHTTRNTMPLGTTPVPYHTGGRGAVRTLDKGFHRVVRVCDINRFVSAALGDSGAAGVMNNALLDRYEEVLNLNQTDPDHHMKVVPGTVNVRARTAAVAGDNPGSGLQASFIPAVWTVEAQSDNLPIPADFPLASVEPYVGPDGHVQQFPVILGVGSFITFTLGTGTTTRFILLYVRQPGAGTLRVTLTSQTGAVREFTVSCDGALSPRAISFVAPAGSTIRSAKVERLSADTGTVNPRVLAYHFDRNAEPNQLMHCNMARGGSTSADWRKAAQRVATPLMLPPDNAASPWPG